MTDGNLRKPATIGDVAALAGVSRSAVSRSYTPGAYVSKAVRERVKAAADALGYRPNLVARSLSTRQSKIVAVAITRLENAFHAALLQALSVELSKAGYRVLLFITDPLSDGDPPIDEVLRHRVDGIILCAVRLSSHFAQECQNAGVPVVLLNRVAEKQAVSMVAGNNRHGGRLIAEFLIAGRHRAPAFIAGFDDSSTSRERERGFLEGLAAAEISLAGREVGNFDAKQAAAACRRLLSATTPPDAIFCANDHMAISAMDVARREFGRNIGHNLSIIGFDDAPPAALAGIDLTTFSQSPFLMAQEAIRLLDQQLKDSTILPVSVIVPGELVVRSSTRAPHD